MKTAILIFGCFAFVVSHQNSDRWTQKWKNPVNFEENLLVLSPNAWKSQWQLPEQENQSTEVNRFQQGQNWEVLQKWSQGQQERYEEIPQQRQKIQEGQNLEFSQQWQQRKPGRNWLARQQSKQDQNLDVLQQNQREQRFVFPQKQQEQNRAVPEQQEQKNLWSVVPSVQLLASQSENQQMQIEEIKQQIRNAQTNIANTLKKFQIQLLKQETEQIQIQLNEIAQSIQSELKKEVILPVVFSEIQLQQQLIQQKIEAVQQILKKLESQLVIEVLNIKQLQLVAQSLQEKIDQIRSQIQIVLIGVVNTPLNNQIDVLETHVQIVRERLFEITLKVEKELRTWQPTNPATLVAIQTQLELVQNDINGIQRIMNVLSNVQVLRQKAKKQMVEAEQIKNVVQLNNELFQTKQQPLQQQVQQLLEEIKQIMVRIDEEIVNLVPTQVERWAQISAEQNNVQRKIVRLQEIVSQNQEQSNKLGYVSIAKQQLLRQVNVLKAQLIQLKQQSVASPEKDLANLYRQLNQVEKQILESISPEEATQIQQQVQILKQIVQQASLNAGKWPVNQVQISEVDKDVFQVLSRSVQQQKQISKIVSDLQMSQNEIVGKISRVQGLNQRQRVRDVQQRAGQLMQQILQLVQNDQPLLLNLVRNEQILLQKNIDELELAVVSNLSKVNRWTGPSWFIRRNEQIEQQNNNIFQVVSVVEQQKLELIQILIDLWYVKISKPEEVPQQLVQLQIEQVQVIQQRLSVVSQQIQRIEDSVLPVSLSLLNQILNEQNQLQKEINGLQRAVEQEIEQINGQRLVNQGWNNQRQGGLQGQQWQQRPLWTGRYPLIVLPK